MSKAALKTFAEGLEHELRNTEGNKLKTCLLVPGWTNSDLVLKIRRAAAEAEGKNFDPGVSLWIVRTLQTAATDVSGTP